MGSFLFTNSGFGGFFLQAIFIMFFVGLFLFIVFGVRNSVVPLKHLLTKKYQVNDLLGHKFTPFYKRKRIPFEKDFRMYTARRGKGKTIAATWDGIRYLRAGIPVYCNYELTDWRYGLRAGRIYSIEQLAQLQKCVVIIDEANLWFDSRKFADIPTAIRASWAMSRKFGLGLIITVQHPKRADLILRELNDHVIVCDRIWWLPKFIPIFIQRWCYIEDVEETTNVNENNNSIIEEFKSLVWMPADAFEGYDTGEIVRPSIKGGAEVYPALVHPKKFDRDSKMWVDWDDLDTDASVRLDQLIVD